MAAVTAGRENSEGKVLKDQAGRKRKRRKEERRVPWVIRRRDFSGGSRGEWSQGTKGSGSEPRTQPQFHQLPAVRTVTTSLP